MKDIFCSYYTNSDSITNYMVERLKVENGDILLEPSAGEGIFIDEILKRDIEIQIDALDINPEAIDILERKYRGIESVTVRKTDTLLDEKLDVYGIQQLWLKETDTLTDKQLDLFNQIGGHYTKVIGNPPYGAWQDYEKRNLLKKKYAGHYVKETYSLFLLRCISVLKMGGRLSFIIPDTFLFLKMHARLREFLLTKTKINEILIFPSKFFPGVSFGYSNLSIITLERSEKKDALANNIKVISGFNSPDEFQLLINPLCQVPEHLRTLYVNQEETLSNANHCFVLAEDEQRVILNSAQRKLGDVADVVTGFYTGDNVRFIRAMSKDVKGSKQYSLVDPSLIYDCSSCSGIANVDEGYVPYVKSASSRKYTREKDEWFVRWDCATIEFYKNNRKTRFQNAQYYFKRGIAIPMVKSKTIKAFLMENRVFDQSIVGIFPNDKDKMLYILALMNSDVINQYILIINPTANNSANYVKQLPYIEPGRDTLDEIQELVSQIIYFQSQHADQQAEEVHEKVNKLIELAYKESGIYV